MMLKDVHIRGGARVTEITSVGHDTERNVGYWFFMGRLRWEDSGKDSNEREIAPHELCSDTDEGRAEIRDLLKSMNEYLAVAGEWHDSKHTRDDRVYSWTPHAKKGGKSIDAAGRP